MPPNNRRRRDTNGRPPASGRATSGPANRPGKRRPCPRGWRRIGSMSRRRCPASRWALTNRHTSRPIAAGVMITARAKLNSSTRALTAPSSRPVEIVAPERENPRNGRHNPWTAPIQAASRIPISRLRAVARSASPAIKIKTPAAASAAATSPRLSKSNSISAFGSCPLASLTR